MERASNSDQYVDWTFDDAEARGCANYVSPTLFALVGALPGGTRVLDIGCGNGALAGLFIQRGCRVVGIDLSVPGVEIARAAHPTGRFEILTADENVLSTLDEDPFDLVVSTEVIEHLYAPMAFLKGCHAALRPHGKLVLSTPYHGWLKNVFIATSGKSDFHYRPMDQGGHIKFWSRKTLTNALGQAGFTNIQFSGAGRLPYLWKSMVIAAERGQT